jgi:hypothetical protein
MTKDYYRNRPFLIAHLSYVPRQGVNTSRKGWMDNEQNVRIMERISIVDRLNRTNENADVVLDIINAKTLRNRTRLSDDDLFADYASRYSQQIEQALQLWAVREVENMGSQQVQESVSEGALLESLKVIAQSFASDKNDDSTRSRVTASYNEFLKGTSEVHSFTVQCDSENNTAERINNNELWIDVGLQFEEGGEYTYVPVRVSLKEAQEAA